MKKIVLAVKITIKEQYVEEITKELFTLHKLTHKEDRGCIQYDLHKVAEDKNSLMIIETWEDEASLNEHKEKEHFINFMQLSDGKIKSMNIDILEKL